MAVASFNTLKFFNRLKDAGVPEKQAQAEAEALAEALEVNLKDLATKEDLNSLKIELRQELREMELRTNARIDLQSAEIKNLRTEIKGDIYTLKWMFGVLVTMVAGLVTMVAGLFFRLFFMHGPI